MSERTFPQRLDSLPHLALLWFAILAPPTAWMAHLTVEYFFVTVQCQLNGGSTAVLMIASTVISLILCLAGGAAGYLAWRRLKNEESSAALNRARFMAASALILSVLFLVGIVLAIVPVYALEECNAFH